MTNFELTIYPKMEEPPFNQKRLIEELIRGRDSTKKLQSLVRRKIEGDVSVSVDDLVTKVLGSFSSSLSVLSPCVSGEDPATGDVGSDGSGEGCVAENGKKPAPAPAPAEKNRRGCYKRRKTTYSRTEVANTMEDGYGWRKYGQKEILNAKFPRCYFRCTNKNTGCNALKQVQKLEDESKLFHITYFGHHTCQDVHKNKNVFSDPGALNSFLINFEDSNKFRQLGSPSTITDTHIPLLVKQENDSKTQSDNISDNVSSVNYDRSSVDMWKNMRAFGNSEPSYEARSMMGFDQEDSCASVSPRDYLDLDFLKDVDSLNDFRLDEVIFS